MKTHSTCYLNAFIEVAEDSRAEAEYARLNADKALKHLKAMRSAK